MIHHMLDEQQTYRYDELLDRCEWLSHVADVYDTAPSLIELSIASQSLLFDSEEEFIEFLNRQSILHKRAKDLE